MGGDKQLKAEIIAQMLGEVLGKVCDQWFLAEHVRNRAGSDSTTVSVESGEGAAEFPAGYDWKKELECKFAPLL